MHIQDLNFLHYYAAMSLAGGSVSSKSINRAYSQAHASGDQTMTYTAVKAFVSSTVRKEVYQKTFRFSFLKF